MFVLGALACLMVAGQASGQANYTFQPANGDYYVNDNWLSQDGLQMFVPSWEFDEIAIITSDSTATVSSDGSNITEADPSPGRLVLGNNPGTTGTLIIQSGGSLAVKANSTTGLSAGNVNVGNNSSSVGVLDVLPGGTFSSEGPLTMAGTVDSTLTVGDATGAGAATLSPNSAVLSRNTRVYSNASFNAATTLSFDNNSVYTVEVNSFGNGSVSATETTTLDGRLHLNFTGVSPAVGGSWTVAGGAEIVGGFDQITSSVPLPFGQSYTVSTAAGGPGEQAIVTLEEVLVLEVNRNSGVATISQPGNNSLEMDGYFVGSDSIGSLDPAGWTSFASQGTQGTGWLATANDANTIGEVKSSGSTSIASGASVGLGAIYNPFGADFGTLGEDLDFVYTRPSDGAVINGIVNYTGTRVNTLLLQVDPASGEAVLKNTSESTVDIDEYTIQSASDSLSPAGWTSFDGQDVDGDGAWLELLNTDSGLLGEVNALGATTLAPGASLNLGNVFLGDETGTRDLDFQFLLLGDEDPTQGVVVYELDDLPGDLNGDGFVGAGDLGLVLNNWGTAATSVPDGWIGNPQPTAPNIGSDELGAVLSAWGSGNAPSAITTAAIPEPSTCLLGILLSAAAMSVRHSRR